MITGKQAPILCPMCQNETQVQDLGSNDNEYCQCTGCEGLFLFPMPEVQPNLVFESAEGALRQRELEAKRENYFLRHLLELEKRMPRNIGKPRLMEVGCGSGVLLRLAHKRGWQADALELSAELAAIAQHSNPQATIYIVNVLDHVVKQPTYDAVMALDVLEHVVDPGQMLANCCQMLKPGGLILIQTPNTRSLRSRLQGKGWDMRDPDQHLNLFSEAGLKTLLQMQGFEVVHLATVSGSGMEQGVSQILASIKQWALNAASLGNALRVVARKI